MAFLEFHYYSKALQKHVAVNVLLPERDKADKAAGIPDGAPYKTLYLYHGLSSDYTAWMRRSSIERYAADYNIAVVMPDVARSWYTNTKYGMRYFDFVADELPEVCRGYFRNMSDKREDNYVAGLSMGGYGALKAALHRPDKFCGCASLSGSIDMTRKGRPETANVTEWRSIFDYGMEHPDDLEGTEHDLFAVTRRNAEAGLPFPKMYLWCGTEDALIHANRRYRDLLTELGVEHRFEESEGDHSWKWWDLHVQDALRYLLAE